MKRKYLFCIFIMIAAIFCAIGLAACDSNNPKGDENSEHEHVLVYHEAKEPTCTEGGNTKYWTCSECGKYFSDENGESEITDKNSVIISAKGHSWSEWSITEVATCTKEGLKTRECSVCHEKETEKTEKTAHALTAHSATPATCAEDGNTEYWECKVCGKYFSDKDGKTEITDKASVIIPAQHTLMHRSAIAATCTENGNAEYWECSACGKYFSDKNGENEITDKNSVIISAKGHNWGEWSITEAATCTKEGIKTRECSVCHEKETEKTEKTAHALAAHSSTPATCTESGNTEYWECETCGKYFSDKNGENEITDKNSVIISAKGHSWGEWSITETATCTKEGLKTRECSVCHEKETEKTEKAAHALTRHSATPATCTEDGNMEYWECEVCGKYFSDKDGKTEIPDKASVIIPAQHTLTHRSATSSTCTEDGNTEYWECSVCGKYFSDKNGENEITDKSSVIIVARHTLTYHEGNEANCTNAGNIEYWECSVCGKYFADKDGKYEIEDKSSVIIPASHTLIHYEATQATCVKNGNIEYWACSVCDKYFADESAEEEIVDKSSVWTDKTAHEFDEWMFDIEYHWRRCVNCGEVCDHIEHTIVADENGRDISCSICGMASYSIVSISSGASYNLGDGAVLVKIDYRYGEEEAYTNPVFVMPTGTFSNWGVITGIANGVFYYAKDLQVFVFADSVTHIQYEAFASLQKLEKVMMGTGLRYINSDAFKNCTSLKEVHIRDIEAWCNIAFSSEKANPLYYAHNLYLNGELVTELRIPDGVTKINDYAFVNCTSLKSVYVPASVTNISSSAFNGCNGLTIYCEAESAPDGWSYRGSCPVVWNAGNGGDTDENGRIITEINGIRYALKDGYATVLQQVTNLTGNTKIEAVIEYKGQSYIVNAIEDKAFYNCSQLKGILIPASVAKIGSDAFTGCDLLNAVYIDDLSAWIAIGFDNQNSNPLLQAGNLYLKGKLVTELSVPQGVKIISEYAFYGCTSIESIVLPSSVTQISDLAFGACTSLKSISFGSDLTGIGESAFAGCSSLDAVFIPDNVTSLGRSVFSGCSSLKSVTIGNGILIIPNSAFSNCSSLIAIDFGNSVTEIGNWAFEECGALKTVAIPDQVTKLGESAFEGCILLETVKIGAGITVIEVSVFEGCTALHDIELSGGITKIGAEAFYGCTSLETIKIPNGVTTIGNSAFYGCKALKSIILPDSLNSVGSSLFSRCVALKDVTIGNGLEIIEDSMFNGCIALETIEIPNGVTTIGNSAFHGCTSLVSVSLSENLTEIGKNAFQSCKALTEITLPANLQVIGGYAFRDCSSLENIAIPDSITEIDDYTFANCTILSNVTLSKNLTEIGSYAFSYCEKLSSIKFFDSLMSIGSNAFYNCTSLQSVAFGSSVLQVERDAFRNCEAIDSVYISDLAKWSVSNFMDVEDTNPLSYAEKIYIDGELTTEINIPEGVTAIGVGTFSGAKITSVTIPDSVTTIGVGAFVYCSNLTELNLGGGVQVIGTMAFGMCTALENIVIPDSVTEIQETAFIYVNLKSLSIGSELQVLGEQAFIPMVNTIESITVADDNLYFYASGNCLIEKSTGKLILGAKNSVIPNDGSVKIIGFGAFYGCGEIKSLFIPDSITVIEEWAFEECTVESVFFEGTTEQWSSVEIEGDNAGLDVAVVYFYTDISPADDGNYWHYVNGIPTVWTKETT